MANESESLEKTYSRKIREADEDSIQGLVKDYLIKCAGRLKKQIQADEALVGFGAYKVQDGTMMSTAAQIKELQDQSTAAKIQELQAQIAQTYCDLKMQDIWPKW